MKISHTSLCTVPASLALVMLVAGGCTSNKAGMESPELPAKHWLQEAPGIPVENKSKYEAAVPSLYQPDKKFGFEDCVYLTLQQSPALINSVVNIEIKRLDTTSAIWKFLPEPHIVLRVSQNITNYNNDAKGVDDEYGQPRYEISYYAPFPNPVATYFEIKAQSMMTGIAISTHRKAVAKAIYEIAQAYLKLQAQQKSLEAKRSLLPLAREMTEYWQKVEAVDGKQGSAVSFAKQHERETELSIEKAEMEEAIQRTKLKVLAGVDPNQKFNIDVSKSEDILKGFDGKKIRWENSWLESEDNLLLRAQLKLADYNIMLAWAQYFPKISVAVNMNPGRGQSQPADGPNDQFAHLSFDFPLIDWGRRYRGVQTARMSKAKAFHSIAQKRFEYQNLWLQAEQGESLAMTNLKLAANKYKTAEMQYDEARIAFESGLEQLPRVAECQGNMVEAQIAYIDTELRYRLAQLNWMFVSGKLERRFLGLPDKELSEFVGGSDVASSGSGGLAPHAEDGDEPVFQDAKAEAKDDKSANRPIGHAKPMKLPEQDKNGDLNVSPEM